MVSHEIISKLRILREYALRSGRESASGMESGG